MRILINYIVASFISEWFIAASICILEKNWKSYTITFVLLYTVEFLRSLRLVKYFCNSLNSQMYGRIISEALTLMDSSQSQQGLVSVPLTDIVQPWQFYLQVEQLSSAVL